MYIALLLPVFCFVSGVLSNNSFSRCDIKDLSCLDKLVNSLKLIVYYGIPELGIPSSDPLFVEKIEGNVSKFNYKFINTTFVEFTKCDIINAKFNEDLTKFQFDMDCPGISMSGKYDMNGELIALPVEGNGDFELKTGKYFIHFETDVALPILDDGKAHMVFTDFTVKCVPQSPMEFDFKNLYNGEKNLSDAFHKFLHEHWQPVAELVQDQIWHFCLSMVVKNMNTYLNHFPADNLFLNF